MSLDQIFGCFVHAIEIWCPGIKKNHKASLINGFLSEQAKFSITNICPPNSWTQSTLCCKNILIKCLHSIPHHHAIFYRKSNEILYPGKYIIKLVRYRISLTSCKKKWQNDKLLKLCVRSKLFFGSVPFKNYVVYSTCTYVYMTVNIN